MRPSARFEVETGKGHSTCQDDSRASRKLFEGCSQIMFDLLTNLFEIDRRGLRLELFELGKPL
jgi:hypothetical protein